MIVCYAEGGGLGHLTRLRAYLHTAGLTGRPVTVITGSPFASDPRVRGDWRVLHTGPDLGGAEIVRALAGLEPQELILDAFPAGLRGELTAARVPSGVRVTHLARLLRWDAYRRRLPADPPRLHRTHLLEAPAPEHLAYLRAHSDEVDLLELEDPPDEGPHSGHGAHGVHDPDVPADGWVIVHSGPPDEITQLVSYALDVAALGGVRPAMTLVCPASSRPGRLPDGIAHRDLYPVRLPSPSGFTGMVFTAAGFNAVRGLAPWRARGRHRMLPFPRTLDDQFTRARRARRTQPDQLRQIRRSNSTATSSASLSAPRSAE